MTTKPPYYRIYLLTVWREQPRSLPDGVTWRFRLQNAGDGQQQLFADAASLVAALEKIASTPDEPEN
jgi:hypothetical protein